MSFTKLCEDLGVVYDACAFLDILADGGTFEIRIPECPERVGGSFRSTASGYFDDAHAAANAITKAEKLKPTAIYVTVNPVEPALLARSANRLQHKAKSSTAKSDVTRRRWLFIDIDATRPAGISATDNELEEAGKVCDDIATGMAAEGWPSPMVGMSGNGFYLFWRIDLPNDAEGEVLVKSVLHALADRYNNDKATVDCSTFDANRLCKVLGTMARKGDEVGDRHHRRSHHLEPTLPLEVVSVDQLRELVDSAGQKTVSPIGDRPPTEVVSRAKRYVAKMPAAVAGEKGHNKLLSVARTLVVDFDLPEADALAIIANDYNPRCEPPWSDRELRHKLSEANKLGGNRGRLVANQLDLLEAWRSETPIRLDDHDLKPIPPDTFGNGWLGQMVDAVSRSLETPIELAGFLGVAAVASAVQRKFTLLVEPGYFEPLTLWVAVAMEPSNRKSAALKYMADPIANWEDQQNATMTPLRDDAMSRRKTVEKIIEAMRNSVHKKSGDEQRLAIDDIAKMESELPEIPAVPMIRFNDSTPEKLASLLQEHRETLAFLDSEADSLFAMMLGKYSDQPSLDVYLKGWSGESTMVHRVNRDPVRLSHPLLTLGVAPQPSVIRSLSKKPILVQRGLLGRFLFSIPKSKVGFRDLEPNAVSDFVISDYQSGLGKLLATEVGETSKVIRLDGQAYKAWKSWQREVEAMMRPDQPLADSALMAWGGKLAGNTARLAGVLHCADCGSPESTPVAELTMRRAIEAARVMIGHSVAVHDLAATDDRRSRARAILEWLRRHPHNQVRLRDLQQSLKRQSLFDTAADIRSGCETLVELGWLLRNDGRKPESYFVHPAIGPPNGDIGDIFLDSDFVNPDQVGTLGTSF